MKCLSLWQPWATLLVTGHKRVETRGWPIRHRGPLLVHAAKKWNRAAADLCLTEPFRSALAAFGVPPAPRNFSAADMVRRAAGWDLPFGAVIGRVDVVECYRTEDVLFDSSGLDVIPRFPVDQVRNGKLRLWPDPERAFGDYSPGRFAFLCANPVRFDKPIPCIGRQGLFNVEGF
jgi:hypothetical protein